MFRGEFQAAADLVVAPTTRRTSDVPLHGSDRTSAGPKK
jgi:hypothetical protein